ncbi:MAG: RNA polymerase sigma factor SigY [Bacillota bacterium]
MEEQLVKRARDGDQDALAQLLYNNYEIIHKYLIKFTFNKTLAEDLAQETMVKAIEKIEYYDKGKSKFSTWLIAISQNIYLDYLRKRKTEKKYTDAGEEALLDRVNIEMYTTDDSLNQVLEALGKLDEAIRFPILLKHYYGYSYEEIAKKMSVPLGTVKSRIHNGLGVMRRELGYDDGE